MSLCVYLMNYQNEKIIFIFVLIISGSENVFKNIKSDIVNFLI